MAARAALGCGCGDARDSGSIDGLFIVTSTYVRTRSDPAAPSGRCSTPSGMRTRDPTLRAGPMERLGIGRGNAAWLPRRALEQTRPRRAGSVFAAIADFGADSPTAGTVWTGELDRTRAIFVGAGLGNGFQALSATASMPTWSTRTGRRTRPTRRSPGTTRTSASPGPSPTNGSRCPPRTAQTRPCARSGTPLPRPRGRTAARREASRFFSELKSSAFAFGQNCDGGQLVLDVEDRLAGRDERDELPHSDTGSTARSAASRSRAAGARPGRGRS